MRILQWISTLAGAILVALAIAAPVGAQSARERGNMLIMGQGMRRSFNVLGKRVTVRGNGNRITWSGYTPVLRVTGTGNRVYADAARLIIVSGRNNQVYWKRRYNGRSPRISRSGTGNWVTWSRTKKR